MRMSNRKNTTDRPLPKGLASFLTEAASPTTIPAGPKGTLCTYTVYTGDVVTNRQDGMLWPPRGRTHLYPADAQMPLLMPDKRTDAPVAHTVKLATKDPSTAQPTYIHQGKCVKGSIAQVVMTIKPRKGWVNLTPASGRTLTMDPKHYSRVGYQG